MKRRTEAAENLLQENEPVLLGTCTFTDGAYQVVAPGTSTYHRCTAQNTSFGNFAYEVELTIVTGDCGGMLFRASASLWHYYYFRICQDGTYALYLYTHWRRVCELLLRSSENLVREKFQTLSSEGVSGSR